MGVTAILSTAVLLETVTSPLPNVSYTVALEWGYYAFILLSAACVFVAMTRWRWERAGREGPLRTLTLGARIGYPLYVIAIVAGYVLTV